MMGVLTSFYDTNVVIMAEVITLSITVALTIYALQTKYDFTDKGGYLLAALIGLLVFGILNILIAHEHKFYEYLSKNRNNLNNWLYVLKTWCFLLCNKKAF